MLIFGWGDRPKFVASGSFPCPVCKTDTNYVHLRHRRWLTFFFIPVIPLSKPFDTVACQKCQSSIPISSDWQTDKVASRAHQGVE
jgi:zinc-ribbon family